MIRPLFSFYGSKWRAARKYPAPQHSTIIEPFAGSAGYALRYPDRQVILCERDPVIAELWRYLIASTSSEILSLPLIDTDQTVDNLSVSAGARSLIGFWLNKGTSAPCARPSKWFRSGYQSYQFWGKEIRARTAAAVEQIKHWQIIEGDYTSSPNVSATWFIDPPYLEAGRRYKHGSKAIDYTHLSRWCRERAGQVMVCENVGAEWLPFEPFIDIKSNNATKTSREALWCNV